VVKHAKSGVEATKNAGIKCVGYRNPHDQDLSKADIATDDFSKLDIKKVLVQIFVPYV
jgi:beta-phosphoglucomutase-like phosphatase (HAD superfamily)